MKECRKCGGSAYREYAAGCEHEFPECTTRPSSHRVERAWIAEGVGVDGKVFVKTHPTESGAIAAWHAEYRRRRDEGKLWEGTTTNLGRVFCEALSEPPTAAKTYTVIDPATLKTRVVSCSAPRTGTTADGDKYTVVPGHKSSRIEKPLLSDGSIVTVSAATYQTATAPAAASGDAKTTVVEAAPAPKPERKIEVGSRVRNNLHGTILGTIVGVHPGGFVVKWDTLRSSVVCDSDQVVLID